MMTQTILDISLSLDGFATAAKRPARGADGHGHGQGWVDVVVDEVHGQYKRAAHAVEILSEPLRRFDGARRGYSARDHDGNLWSLGTMSPGANR
jgi:hypothetical protein